MTRLKKFLYYALFALSLIGFDRYTKVIAKEHLMDQEALSYFSDTFRLEYVENTGAFLSLGSDLPRWASFWIFSVFPLIFLLLLLGYMIKKSSELRTINLIAFVLVFAGGLGNIIDRIMFDRHVTDFMNMGIGSLRTGIFNFADVYVMVGMGILLVFFRETKQAVEKIEESVE